MMWQITLYRVRQLWKTTSPMQPFSCFRTIVGPDDKQLSDVDHVYWDHEIFTTNTNYICWWCGRWPHSHHLFNRLKPRQNGHHFPDDIFKCILMNENVWISLSCVLKFPIDNIPGADKQLSEPMMVGLLTHICVIRPQWFNRLGCEWSGWLCKWHIQSHFYSNFAYVSY